MAGGYEEQEGNGEGLNLGGTEEKENEEEEETQKTKFEEAQENLRQHIGKGWNDKRNAWENWQYESPGAYYMGNYENPYQGVWEEWNPGMYVLYKNEEKVDAGEVVDTGFKVRTRKKFRNKI